MTSHPVPPLFPSSRWPPPHLYNDLALELSGGGQLISDELHRLHQQLVPEHVPEDPCHLPLLDDAAVLLNGQHQWVSDSGKMLTQHLNSMLLQQ